MNGIQYKYNEINPKKRDNIVYTIFRKKRLQLQNKFLNPSIIYSIYPLWVTCDLGTEVTLGSRRSSPWTRH